PAPATAPCSFGCSASSAGPAGPRSPGRYWPKSWPNCSAGACPRCAGNAGWPPVSSPPSPLMLSPPAIASGTPPPAAAAPTSPPPAAPAVGPVVTTEAATGYIEHLVQPGEQMPALAERYLG